MSKQRGKAKDVEDAVDERCVVCGHLFEDDDDVDLMFDWQTGIHEYVCAPHREEPRERGASK